MKLKCQPAEERANIEKRIAKNRDEIDKILHQDWSIDLMYMRINMLSAQNKQLIAKLNTI